MNPANQYKVPFVKLLFNLVFLVGPTLLIMYLFIPKVNEYLSVLNTDFAAQTLYFAGGTVIAYILYLYRVRFIITFPLLLLLLYTGYKSIESYYPGEFDSFFAAVRFQLFAVLFTLGWLTGFGLARWRHFPIALAVTMISIHLIMLSDTKEILFYKLTWDLVPIIIYAFYIIYVRSILDNLQELTLRRFMLLLLKQALFLTLIYGLFQLTQYVLERDPDFRMLVDTAGAGGGRNGESSPDEMLKKNDNSTYSMKDYAELRPRLAKSDELLFCSYIDNFFEGSEVPNPLYFTYYYLPKYNTQKERFERDPNMPSNDLMEVDPAKIPLFFTQTDSSVIEKGKGNELRRSIDVDVYINKLSPSAFVSPSTAYSCQPITIEDDFKDMFQSAYRTRCYISELNSAYFVYNTDQPEIKAFQENRFKVLNKVKDYKGVDQKFMDYYTEVPKGATFDSITNLAKEITKNAKTPIEKVLAVRDHFLSKTESGEPLFVYTLTPGNPNDPNIPNASKLSYFLFQNRRGYCTYFAGATNFLLRSVGIPTRMTAGFMTVDRADKNKGWYWFYADQAHAWVQVYFPGYGWLDFDTTIGAEEAEQSPQPDGTPPIQPPKAWLAATGTITEKSDSITRIATFELNKMVYHDKELQPKEPYELKLDLKNAVIKDRIGKRSYNNIYPGDEVLIVSYNQKLKNLGPHKKGQVEKLLDRFPSPVPVDEVHIKPKEQKKPEEEANKKDQIVTTKGWNKNLLWLLLILVVIPFIPWLCFIVLRARANNSKDPRTRSYRIFRLSEFLYNQMGYPRWEETPFEYARNVIDKEFGTNYTEFMQVYLKTKYSNLQMNEYDVGIINSYHPAFIKTAFERFTIRKRISRFLNLVATLRFFMKRTDERDKA